MVVGRSLATCGINVGWTVARRGLDTGWTYSGQVVVGQPTSSPPPVHVTACWTFNGPYCTKCNNMLMCLYLIDICRGSPTSNRGVLMIFKFRFFVL